MDLGDYYYHYLIKETEGKLSRRDMETQIFGGLGERLSRVMGKWSKCNTYIYPESS